MDEDLVEEIKDAISFVAKDRFFYCMSEADLERCIAAELRDRDHVVLEQYPVVPTWHTEQGTPVALHGRRADLWILSKTGLRMLVELKIATKIEESHRAVFVPGADDAFGGPAQAVAVKGDGAHQVVGAQRDQCDAWLQSARPS